MIVAPPLSSPPPTPLPPGRTQGYLEPASGGSKWLFHPKQTPEGLDHGYRPGNVPVDPRAAAADLRLFDDLLRDTYGRYGQYRDTNLDVAALAEQHANRVEKTPSITLDEALTPLIKDLRKVLPDHHLVPLTSGFRELETDAELASNEYRGDAALLGAATAVPGAVAATAEAVKLLRADGTLGNVGSITIKGRDGVAALSRLGYRSVNELVPPENLSPIVEPVYDFRVAGDVGVIRLTSFMTDEDDVSAAHQRLLADLPRHRKLSRLVVDVRGAAGGHVGYLSEWARQLRAPSTRLSTPYAGAGFNSERQGLISMWNTGVSAAINEPENPATGTYVEQARQVQQRFPLKPVDTPSGDLEPASDEYGSAESDWTGEMIVLVDRRNGSSSELGPLLLRDWLGATIAGERTGGFLEGLNVMPYQLPNTGYSLIVPSLQVTFKDPRVSEGAGVPVSVALEDPAMPAERVATALFGTRPT